MPRLRIVAGVNLVRKIAKFLTGNGQHFIGWIQNNSPFLSRRISSLASFSWVNTHSTA